MIVIKKLMLWNKASITTTRYFDITTNFDIFFKLVYKINVYICIYISTSNSSVYGLYK